MAKYIAVIGATGQMGNQITRNLLKNGHQVRIISRGREFEVEAFLTEFCAAGAEYVICEDMLNLEQVAQALQGCDTLLATVPGSAEMVTIYEPLWVDAAVKAGIKRIVPSEFGAHTRNLAQGGAVGFYADNKISLHEKIFASGLEWTFFYNGYIFDYGLPNLRFFNEITTFGDLDMPLYAHDIKDLGYVAAIAVTDPRTANKCVQMDFNCLNQKDMLHFVEKYWSDQPLVYKHYSKAYITYMTEHAGDDITAKKGAETDRERWGINNLIYVLGKLAAFTDETIRGTELCPDYVCKTPEEAIKDPKFFLDQK